MGSAKPPANPNWRAIALFYLLACLWSWPFFWWRDIHAASWDALPVADEVKGLLQPWGPGLAAVVIFYLFPAKRSMSLSGGSWQRSTICFAAPIAFALLASSYQSGRFSYKLIYYLTIGGFSTLGEELGWRGYLQEALLPLGRIKGYLLLALLWEAWHFTSHTKGTWPQVVSRLEIIIPIVIASTFVLAWFTERTGSVILATSIHEWIDIGFDTGGYFLWAALAAVPVWLWLAWTWRPVTKRLAPMPAELLS